MFFRQIKNQLKRQVSIAFALGLYCGQALAAQANARAVFIPLVFDIEHSTTLTRACLKGVEQDFQQNRWWQNNNAAIGRDEQTLIKVIAAMRKKDQAALYHLSEAANRKRFDNQAAAYFAQLQAANIIAIPWKFDLGGAVVFYAKLSIQNDTGYAAFAFARSHDGQLKFLPGVGNRTDIALMNKWFYSPWGPARSGQPTYCARSTINHATHRVPIRPHSDAAVVRAGMTLFLTGGSLTKPGPVKTLLRPTKSLITKLEKSAEKNDIKGIASQMDPAEASHLLKWAKTATAQQRARYAKSLATLKPFYLFDASPVIIVYVKTRAGIQVMYLAKDKQNKLRWINAARLVLADRVFKRGLLYAAAKTEPAFHGLRIK
jgi:hypothetical protein